MLLEYATEGTVNVAGLSELRLTLFTGGLRNIFPVDVNIEYVGIPSKTRFIFFDHTDTVQIFASLVRDGNLLTVKLTDSTGTQDARLYVEGR